MLLSGSAFAGDRATAQSLFEAGKALMREGRIDEACPKFAESLRVYPSVGAQLNLARCHELQGKTASAWTEYSKAATMARAAGDEKRATKAREFADRLEPQLSKLTIDVPVRTEGLEVTRNGQPVGAASFGVPIAVDPGEHRLEANAPGHEPWSATVVIGKNAAHKTVTVPSLTRAPGGGPASGTSTGGAPGPDQASTGLSTNHYLAIGAGSVGLVGIVLGTVFGLKASSDWDEAESKNCVDNVCDPGARELSEDAQSAATVSTVGFVVGGVAIAGAVVLLLTAPSGDESTGQTATTALGIDVMPLASGYETGLLLRGRF